MRVWQDGKRSRCHGEFGVPCGSSIEPRGGTHVLHRAGGMDTMDMFHVGATAHFNIGTA